MTIDLRAAAAEHLAHRRARGYRLPDHDWLITSFLDDLTARGVTTITVADAVAFVHKRPETDRKWHAKRLHVIRGFAAHVHALDPKAAELVPAGLIHANVTRPIPYLYSDTQITALMSAAANLSPELFAAGIHTFIGLVAATGLRSGEAGALNVQDLHLGEQVLAVTGKYGKQRLVPLHPSTVQALVDYLGMRAINGAHSAPLFIGSKGGRLNVNTVRATFRQLVADCGLPARPGCGKPRLHDLRH